MLRILQSGARALGAEGRIAWAALRERRLLVILATLIALIALAGQAPLAYSFDVGLEDGYGSDRPMIAEFHAPERIRGTTTRLRWTTGRSLIRLPGTGQRALLVKIRLVPIGAETAQLAPRELEVWADGRQFTRVALRPATGGVYDILLPPPADGSGDQQIELRSATFRPSGDRRDLGVPVDQVRVEAAGGPAWPGWASLLMWAGAAALLWLALRRAGVLPRHALAILMAVVALAGLAALLDPLRFGFGAGTALAVAALGWLLILALAAAPQALIAGGALVLLPAIALRALLGDTADWGGPAAAALGVATALVLAGGLRPVLERLYRSAGAPIPLGARRWLWLLALIVFMTHFGGKLYPDSMWGDIGFHSHRFGDVAQGELMMLSSNRGVQFPYPPAFYALLAPLYLTGLDDRLLLRLVGALLDALSPFLVYAIAVRAGGERRTADESSGAEVWPSASPGDSGCEPAWRLGVLAAGLYTLAPATLMTTWWNFSSHIFSQFAHLLLIAVLVVLWRRLAADRRRELVIVRRSAFIGLFVLQVFVYLGHFGFWINMSLLGAIGLAALLIGALRGRVSWRIFRYFLAAYVAAEAFAVLFYYSAYAGLFIAQIEATATSGLTGLANRQAVDRAILLRTLWDAGFRTHFGFFPVPLALCGLILWWARTKAGGRWGAQALERSSVQTALVLATGTFAIAFVFAALPFLTGSTQATRWLMFSAWAIAVGAALTVGLLWRSGRAGRWVVAAMGGYVIWVSASMWLGALAWRLRPPEPF